MSEAATLPGSTCARSTTRPVSGGTSSAKEREVTVKAEAKNRAKESA